MAKVYNYVIPETLISLLDKNQNEKMVVSICNFSKKVFQDMHYNLIQSQSNGEPDIISSENEKYDITLLPVSSLYRGIGKDQSIDVEDIILFKDDYEQKLKELIHQAILKKKNEDNIIVFDIFGLINLREEMQLTHDFVSRVISRTYREISHHLAFKKIVIISPYLLTKQTIVRLFIDGKEIVESREFIDYWDERFIQIDDEQ